MIDPNLTAMKKAFYGFLFLLFAFATIGIISTFFLSSCKDISPDNNKSKSYFSINDELFTITQGGLVNLGSASDESKHPGFMHVVLFTTDGINYLISLFFSHFGIEKMVVWKTCDMYVTYFLIDTFSKLF